MPRESGAPSKHGFNSTRRPEFTGSPAFAGDDAGALDAEYQAFAFYKTRSYRFAHEIGAHRRRARLLRRQLAAGARLDRKWRRQVHRLGPSRRADARDPAERS